MPDEQATPRRFTIRGGGVHPELAEEHPGLFLGAGAYEVEEIGPGHWRLVSDTANELVSDDDPHDDVSAYVATLPPDEQAHIAALAAGPDAALTKFAAMPEPPTVSRRRASKSDAPPATESDPSATVDDAPQNDVASDAQSEPSPGEDAPEHQED